MFNEMYERSAVFIIQICFYNVMMCFFSLFMTHQVNYTSLLAGQGEHPGENF